MRRLPLILPLKLLQVESVSRKLTAPGTLHRIREVKYPSAFSLYPIETIRDLLFRATDRYGSRPSVGAKCNGAYEMLSYLELRRRVEALATHFCHLGLSKGDRIAVISENRPEWVITYLAAVCSGFTIVPIDKDLRDHEIRHLLHFSGARVLVGARDYIRVLGELDAGEPEVSFVIAMDDKTPEAELSFDEALSDGADRLMGGDHRFADATVAPEDTATLIFTSGTTGAPKGVMLSHRNIVANITGTSWHVAIDQDDVLLSVLPLHHTYESTAGFLTALYQGASVCYAEGLRRIVENLRETGASVMLGVPALFEAMYRRMETGMAQEGRVKVSIARGVAGIGSKIAGDQFRRRLFRRLHDRLGGRLRLLISGGAAINPEVSRGFRKLGIRFIQGYGMTEFAPIISVNRIDHFKDGSAGLPLPNAEVRIVDDEILVKGPCVMKGYFRNESATQEALSDGWLRTGDLGHFDRDGFLFISGRRKSVIVTPNGKNVYPEEVEGVLNQSEFVLESLVWGGPEEDPSLTEVQAIVVPDPEAFDRAFQSEGWDDDRIQVVIAEAVRTCNHRLAGYKRIKKFVVRREEFEKTTTRKVKRYLYTAKSKPLRKRG